MFYFQGGSWGTQPAAAERLLEVLLFLSHYLLPPPSWACFCQAPLHGEQALDWLCVSHLSAPLPPRLKWVLTQASSDRPQVNGLGHSYHRRKEPSILWTD